jgi:polysaccharide export outer membrane protein
MRTRCLRVFEGKTMMRACLWVASLVLAVAATSGQAQTAPAPSTPAAPPAASAPAVAGPRPVQVQAAATAPKSATSTYKISSGDAVDIYVWGDDRLSRTLTVLPDGTFSFPLAGTIMAAGHSSTEVEAQLSNLLAPQYKGVPPQVTVSVRAPTGMQISVIGKVHSPGTFSPTRYLSVLDALAMAGGPTDFADVGGIIILRNSGGKVQAIKARLGNVLKGKPNTDELGNLPQLIAGDTVVVP